MAKILYDGTLWTPQESWRTIRNFRASPPESVRHPLSSKGRSDVFHMALEQSEQLFRAAAEVPPDSRPILLFYGLSQAGRAIAAASPELAGNEWQATGHGLKSTPAGLPASDVWNLVTSVSTTRTDLFSRASAALRSPIELGSVELGAAAANILEFVYEYRSFGPFPRVLNAPREYNPHASARSGSEILELPLAIPQGEPVARILQSTPALNGLSLVLDADGTASRDHNGKVLLSVASDRAVWEDGYLSLAGDQRYRGSAVLTRSLGKADRAVHPFMIWWLILFPLSMLARYEPRIWRSVLDMRSSASASQLEYVCDRALDAVPQLLAEALAALGD